MTSSLQAERGPGMQTFSDPQTIAARVEDLRRQVSILEAAMVNMSVAPILMTIVEDIYEAVSVLDDDVKGWELWDTAARGRLSLADTWDEARIQP